MRVRRVMQWSAVVLAGLGRGMPAPAAPLAVNTPQLSVTVDCTSGLNLTSVYGKGNSFYYIGPTTPTALLSYSVNAADSSQYYSGAFANIKCVQAGNAVNISATSPDGLTAFSITLAPDTAPAPGPGSLQAVVVSTQVTYSGPNSPAFFRAMLPNVQGFAVPGGNSTGMGMVPQEIGSVIPLTNLDSPFADRSTLGASASSSLADVKPPAIGLPISFNVMELAEVYDPAGGGGLFLTDLDGDFNKNVPPLQFNLTYSEGSYYIAGYWTAQLKPNQTVTLPRLAIGVHPSGDWHEAADYYVSKRQSSWTFPDTPQWFREAGGIYMVGFGGGGSFIAFSGPVLSDAYFGVQSFACNSTSPWITMYSTTPGAQSFSPPNKPGQRCLLDALSDAQSLGSSVLYLNDYYDTGYLNKGDWLVRSDLGGAAGLAEGIRQVHAAGGRVILYDDSYVVATSSQLLSSGAGDGWQMLPAFPLDPTIAPASLCMYSPLNFCMAGPNSQWQDYIISKSQALVQETGADGVFLDSTGWQMNWPVTTASEDVAYTSQEWSAATLRWMDRIRSALRVYNPEAIVMGESNAGQLPFHWDGGSAADLAFSYAANVNKGLLPASPVRYAMPQANYFANGMALGDLNQVYAAGHNLALGTFWLLGPGLTSTYTGFGTNPPRNASFISYIQSLVHARIQYKDALVYGKQLPMPSTNSSQIVAYIYQGTEHQALTIVNNGAATGTVSVQLPAGMGGSAWTNLNLGGSGGTPVSASAGGLLTLPGGLSAAPQSATDPVGGLAVLVRTAPGPPPAFYPISQTVPLMNEDFGDGTMNHWTVSSGQWSVSALFPGFFFLPAGQLNVQSASGSALAFYDLYGGENFTYSALISLDSVAAGGWVGLGFRLSDNAQNSDAAEQGYEAVLGSTGSAGFVQILKQPGNTVLGTAKIALFPGLPYLLTVTTSGATISVSVDGLPMLSVTDSSYVSGRFGVSSYLANAHFSGLLADDQR